jgi:hypothetical protein
LEIFVNNKKAIIPGCVEFYYGLLWSKDETWGGESPPRTMDSVWVPKGETLIVDVNTPKWVNSVVVEGRIFFADDRDLEFDAKYIIIRKGEFIAGRECKPHENKLTITLHGNYMDD